MFDGRGKVNVLLVTVLGVSLALHAGTVPFLVRVRQTGRAAEERGAYLRKVQEKHRARKISKEVKDKVTMPPPPENPEAVVEGTFKDSLSGDVEKLVGTLLDSKVVKRLADNVTDSLKDDLARISQDIVEGKMTEEEIKKKHEELKKKAHKATMDELAKYRVETQLERAEMSTTEWYEKEMSPTLLGNINYALLVRRIHHVGLWHTVFCGRYTGWTRHRNWSSLRSNRYLGEKIGLLRNLKTGHIRRYRREPNAAWPGPSKEQAAIIERRVKAYYNGTVRMSNNAATYPSPSWKSVIYGDTDEHEAQGKVWETHLSDGILSEFWPHKEDEMPKIAEPLDDRWDALLKRAEQYRERAEAGAGADEMTKLRDACYADIDGICKEAARLRCWDSRPLHAINHGVRVETLTGEMQDRMFKYWTDEMVDALRPLLRKIAKGQFSKGIIVHKAGVDEAMKEFTEKVVPLLRRDVMRMVSRKKFRRLVWTGSPRIYKTAAGEPTSVPTDDDVKQERKKLADLLQKHPQLKAYADKRRELNQEFFEEAIESVKDEILTQVLTGGLLLKQMYVFVEGVDYADKVEEKLNARMAAMQGRGQDLTTLTKDGLPDTQAPLVALFFGASKGHGASLEPVETSMAPGFRYGMAPAGALRASLPRIPGGPKTTGKKSVLPRQEKVEPQFSGHTPRFESIPFLHKFPRLDGDLTDWGEIRPLVLRGTRGEEPIVLYAAWCYQGFFLGYQVKQPDEEFYYPTLVKMRKNMSQYHRDRAAEWPMRGDHLRLLFDTLDARQTRRGEAHTQELVILPRGTDVLPDVPGMERKITSHREADTKEWRGVKSTCKNFDEQPIGGPDEYGPYRITKATKDGYTTEIFIPRKLFKVPVFSPGWCIGFDCAVGAGYQGRGGRGKRGTLRFWASGDAVQQGNRGGNHPNRWGDLLLLGTDPRFLVQDADASGTYPLARFVIPGHSYLLTVVDPDRNISLSRKDSVLVSAEVNGGARDVEVFILKETKANSGIFRGYVNTQPGAGRQVQGSLEVEPGHEVVFGYVDLANGKGERNPITYIRLPVGAPLANVVTAKR